MSGLSTEAILSISPDVTATPYGWLATSPRESSLRIGVTGGSEAEARERFNGELAAWADLAARPTAS